MTLPDRPPSVVRWDIGLEPKLLLALGNLAVISARVEETLHKIYWKYAGLDIRTGPIVTDNLNPKRLEEDILKFVRLDTTKQKILEDLTKLFKEFEDLNTARNRCLHWIWEISEPSEYLGEQPRSVVERNSIPHPERKTQLRRPTYKQSGESPTKYTADDVETLYDRLCWLSSRLGSHAVSEEELRRRRQDLESAKSGPKAGISNADLFWPAPWLDTPLQQGSTPVNRPDAQK
jgi:hypothetical protein